MRARAARLLKPSVVRIARSTYRARGETPVSSGWDLVLKYFMVLIVLGVLVATYGPLAVRHVGDWERFKLDVPVPTAHWKLDLGTSADCADVAAADCDAHPANPRLWGSAVERGDPYVSMHGSGYKPRQYAGDHFWLGTIIDAAALARAARARATHFALGWLNSPYRIWIDGKLAVEGDGTSSPDPIELLIAQSRLEEPRPLYVAVRLQVLPDVPILDSLNEDRMGRDLGVDGHGFMTSAHSVTYHNLIGFWGRSRPFAVALSYLAVAALMFFFWLPLKNKPEYFYMSVFALSGAIFQCERWDLLHFGRSAAVNSAVELFSLFWTISLGTITTLAFARVKNRIIYGYLAATASVPALVYWLVPAGGLHELFKLLTVMVYLPVSYFAAGAVCLFHAYHLAEQSRSSLSAPVRIRRLIWVGIMSLANGLLFLLLFHNLASEPLRLYWLGFEQMAYFISFCGIVLSEYSLQEYLVRNTPVSEYHRRPNLPEMVAGAVLTVDLKNSERLFRAGASIGEGAQFVDKCLASLWSASINAGGVVLQTEGDSLRALFDQAKLRNPVLSALQAADEMARGLREVEASLRSEGLLSPEDPPVSFRGGLSFGKVRPVWLQSAGSRQASWTEVGETNAFVESSRFMDLERSVKDAGPGVGIVVVGESVLGRLAEPGSVRGVVQRQVALIGKHGRTYECAVYSTHASEAELAPRRSFAA